MGLKEQAKSSFKWSILIQFSNQVLGLLITIILARLLDPTDFGGVDIVLIFVSLGRVLMDGGLASSLI
ncbi:MAG: oligosaccharide flippase family protein, partial [Cyclobacteriaceae bacterium]|nr:oligosaccharide flippase family protein [Cyclobacteriaceae bacterium]